MAISQNLSYKYEFWNSFLDHYMLQRNCNFFIYIKFYDLAKYVKSKFASRRTGSNYIAISITLHFQDHNGHLILRQCISELCTYLKFTLYKSKSCWKTSFRKSQIAKLFYQEDQVGVIRYHSATAVRLSLSFMWLIFCNPYK